MDAQPMNVAFSSVDELTSEQASKVQYWATLPKDKIGGPLEDKVTDYDLYTRTYGQLWLWRRSYFMYYKNWFRGGKMLRAGDMGQYKTLSVNHYHSIVQGILTLITHDEPAFTPQAINSDYKSQAQTMAAKSVLDYGARYGDLSRKATSATEKSLLFGEGFVFLDLDMNKGNIVNVDPTTQRPYYDGEITVDVFSPADAIRDFSVNSSVNCDWFIFRKFVNKWDLVKVYPEHEDAIKGESIANDVQMRRFGHAMSEEDDDTICLYTFVHKKTPALPNGRTVKFLSSKTVLADGPLPFDWQVYRIAPADQEETTFGYSPAFDLLAIQEAIDKLISVVITNQLTFGVQNIVAPIGSKLSPQQLMDGLNLILTDMRQGVPKVLELVKTPAEIFEFIKFLIQQMEVISGLNSVSRGVAPESLESGTALAFLQSQSIQANSNLQKSYNRLLENVGTGYLKILKNRPDDPKIMAITGQANRTYLQEVKKKDFADIDRVFVESGNPLTKTTAGRIEVANSLLQYNLLKTPEEFMSVVETGQLNSLMESSMAELLHIRAENEALREGRPLKAIAVQNHPLYIKEHMVVINQMALDNPNDPRLTNAINHLMEHIMLWQSVSPNILAGLGIQPPPIPINPAPIMPPNAAPAASDPKAGAANVNAKAEPATPKAPEGPRPPKNADPRSREAMAQAQNLRQ